MVGLGRGAVEPIVVVYLNRLSDLLFVMARAVESSSGVSRDRVVSDARRGVYAVLRADRHGRTTKTSRWRPCCCRGACGAHVAAVYAFARAADDFADEGARSADERLGLLDGWLAGCAPRRLAPAGSRAAAGRARRHAADLPGARRDHS